MLDHWLHAPPVVADDPPPMPLRMFAGGTRHAFQAKLLDAVRWGVRWATLRGQRGGHQVEIMDDLVDGVLTGILGYRTMDGLDPDGHNPEPVPAAFWPDPVPAREVVNAAVAWYRARKRMHDRAKAGAPLEIVPEEAAAMIDATKALARAVEDLLAERPTIDNRGDIP